MIWRSFFLLCFLTTVNCQLSIEYDGPLCNKSNTTKAEFNYILMTSTERINIDMEFSGFLALSDPLNACETVSLPLNRDKNLILMAKGDSHCSFVHRSKMAKAVGVQMLLVISEANSVVGMNHAPLFAPIPILVIAKGDGEALMQFLTEQNNFPLSERRHAKLVYKPQAKDFPNESAPKPLPPPPPTENSTLPTLRLPIVLSEWEGVIFQPEQIIEWPDGNITAVAPVAVSKFEEKDRYQILTFDRNGVSIEATEIRIVKAQIYKLIPLPENKIGLCLISSSGSEYWSSNSGRYIHDSKLTIQILSMNRTLEREFSLQLGQLNGPYVGLISPTQLLICISRCQGFDLSGNPIGKEASLGREFEEFRYDSYFARPDSVLFFSSHRNETWAVTATLNGTELVVGSKKNLTFGTYRDFSLTSTQNGELLYTVRMTSHDCFAVWFDQELNEIASRKLLPHSAKRGVHSWVKLKNNNILYTWVARDDHNVYGMICFTSNFTIGPKFLIAQNLNSRLDNVHLYPKSDGTVVFVAMRTRGYNNDMLFMKSLDVNGKIISAETVVDGIRGGWNIMKPTENTLCCYKGEVLFKIFLFNETSKEVSNETITREVEPPTKKYGLPRLSIDTREKFAFALPNDLFFDRNNGPITYSATLSNHSLLPSWLQFHPENLTFTGTPVVKKESTLVLNIQGCNSMQACNSAAMTLDLLFSGNSTTPTSTKESTKLTENTSATNNNVTVTTTVTVATTATETTVLTKTVTTTQTKSFFTQIPNTLSPNSSLTVTKTIIVTQTATSSTTPTAIKTEMIELPAVATATSTVSKEILSTQTADTSLRIPHWMWLLLVLEFFFIAAGVLLCFLMKKRNKNETVQLTQETARVDIETRRPEQGKEFAIINLSATIEESS